MSNYRQNIVMNGDGSEQFDIPSGLNYMSVINNTDNVLYIYQEKRNTNEPAQTLLTVPQYTQQTVPIAPGRQGFTVFYVDGGGASPKKADIIFSVENLQIQGTLGTAIAGTVTVVSQTAGLLQASDLSIDAQKHLHVDVETLPDVEPIGKTAVKVTAAGAGDQVVKAAAGKVFGIKVKGAIDVTLKDGGTERWYGNLDGFTAIACDAGITLSFSAAGDAYIIYE